MCRRCAAPTVLHGSGSLAHWPLPRPGSGDADGLRASQLQHAVQHLDRHVHLSRPTLIRTRAQPPRAPALEPAGGGLGSGARVVARGLLPAHPALLGDELQVAVPLRRRRLGRGAGHGGRARRNDDVRARVALGHGGVNALLVVRAVRRGGGDRVRDLVQQGADLGGVVFVAVGQGGGHDPAGLGVHAEMELPPRPAPLGAVLLDQPLARAVELQPRAVDQQVHGAGIAASAAPAPSPRGFGRGTSSVSARRHRVVWSGTARSSPSRPMTEPISPSVSRYASRNTALNVSAVRIARSEYSGCPPRLVRRSASHASTASSENQTVTLPRRRRLSSYSRQFVTLRFCSGMWRRRSWFSLKGKVGIRGSAGEPPNYSSPAPGATGRIRATTQPETPRSSNTRVHPAPRRASSWSSGFWSCVEP